MNKKTLLISMVCLMGFSAIGHAAENKKPVKSWTCEDFLALDESFKPTAIGFAEALNKKTNQKMRYLMSMELKKSFHWSSKHVNKIRKSLSLKKLSLNGKSKKRHVTLR